MLLRNSKKALVKKPFVKQCESLRYITSKPSDQHVDDLAMDQNESENSSNSKAKSTETNSSEPSLADRLLREEAEKNSFVHFWEVKAQANTSKARVQPQLMAKETKQFRNFLEHVFPSKPSSSLDPLSAAFPSPSPSSTTTPTHSIDRVIESRSSRLPLDRSKRDSQTVAEKELLNIVMRNGKPYRSKAPLPDNYRQALGQKPADYAKVLQSRLQEDTITNFLFNKQTAAAAATTRITSTPLSTTETFRMRDLELRTIQEIVETRTPTQLLACILKEINTRAPSYPPYYSKLLKKAIEHATSPHLNDPYLALTIFEQAKHRSMTSYILGCTTKVYNSVLSLRWHEWKDVYGILDLVKEMHVNGVEFDKDSRRLVRDMATEIIDPTMGRSEKADDSGYHDTMISTSFWNEEERDHCRLLTKLVGKWLVTE